MCCLPREDLTGQGDSQLRRRRLNENECRDRRLYDFIMREPCGPRIHFGILSHTLAMLERSRTCITSKTQISTPWSRKHSKFAPSNFLIPLHVDVCVFYFLCSRLLNIAPHCALLQLHDTEASLASLRLRRFPLQLAAAARPQRWSTSPSLLHQAST